ncbi:hypothetical protein GOBAR_AA20759 [Gossypium barbadense]|uniref:Uncharacterized protein n=1 Tax=Gossypium barbadense TaxID=3634 RepID=A0A2P5X994_GOSBA|nr:hypothetical protein GOBAR_AA20759 [Gossypium barbadense]
MKISLVLVHNFNGFVGMWTKIFMIYDVVRFYDFLFICNVIILTLVMLYNLTILYLLLLLFPTKILTILCVAGKMPRRRLRDLSIVQNTTNSEEVSTEQQTVVGSSSVPETLDESVEFQSNVKFILQIVLNFITDLFLNFNIVIIYYFSAENGGTRRGRGRTLLTDLYNLNSVERVKVTRNSHGQPVGQEARLLAGYLGIIARNANMLPINYESWHNMPDSNKNQKALGKKWRDHKSKKLQNVPPGMLRYQWEDAVRFWNSKKGEVLCTCKLL